MATLQDVYDEFERFFNEQIPPNLHELPFRLLESVERIGNELFDSLQVYGPPSISLPLPPFFSDPPPPPPPPPPPLPISLIHRLEKYSSDHPYLLTGYVLGGGLTITAVGLGVHYAITRPDSRAHAFFVKKKQEVSDMRDASRQRASSAWTKGIVAGGLRTRRAAKWRGKVENGFLREAILILAPSPIPSFLIPLTCALLKAGYIVLVAVPHAKEAEDVESKISAIVEGSAVRKKKVDAETGHGTLRVLCYDAEDHSSLGPFQRSLWATLSLRFPVPTSSSLSASQTLPGRAAGDPYAPLPTKQLPTLISVLSLYALHPSPSPSGNNALPALPSIVKPPTASLAEQVAGHVPALVTFLPACGVLQTPETFAQQVISGSQMTLAKNMAIAHRSMKVVYVSVGDIDLPKATSSEGAVSLFDERSKVSLPEVSASTGLGRVMQSGWNSIKIAVFALGRPFGIGVDPASWPVVEQSLLRVVRAKRSGWWSIGRGSFTPRILQSLLPSSLLSFLLTRTDLARVLAITLPTVPTVNANDTTPSASAHSFMPKREQQTTPKPGQSPPLQASAAGPNSVSSFDGESDIDSEDVEHVSVSTGSRSGESARMEGSWVGLGPGGEEMRNGEA